MKIIKDIVYPLSVLFIAGSIVYSCNSRIYDFTTKKLLKIEQEQGIEKTVKDIQFVIETNKSPVHHLFFNGMRTAYVDYIRNNRNDKYNKEF